jgi:hypothetical protein
MSGAGGGEGSDRPPGAARLARVGADRMVISRSGAEIAWSCRESNPLQK